MIPTTPIKILTKLLTITYNNKPDVASNMQQQATASNSNQQQAIIQTVKTKSKLNPIAFPHLSKFKLPGLRNLGPYFP